jgi:hypothetical protein
LFTTVEPVIDLSNVPIHITDADISMGEFFFSIFTNSSHQCDLSVNIFNDSILTHHFTTPNFFTGSSECNYAKQNYDIPYRFTLPPGQYTVDISTSQPVQFYQLHLHHYDQTFVNTLGFEPRDYDPIPTNDCSYNKYVVIPNISAAYGGMWWCIYQALVGIHVADTNNLIPIVNYHGGLYGSNSIYDPPNLPHSWWNYFFEEPSLINPDEKKRVLEYSKSNLQTMQIHRRFRTVLPINETKCYHFYNQLFLRLCRQTKHDMRSVILKYMRPLPYVKKYCDDFWLAHNTNQYTVVGIHYRGTDKYRTRTADEARPIHYDYPSVASIVREKLAELNITQFVLYCSSDELPFIDYMKTQFDDVVYNDHSVRSTISTSGLQYDFNQIRFGKTSDLVQLANYDYVKSLSVHFGNKDKSNFIKGFYSLTDCLLFSKCSVLFLSQGNFSDFAMFNTEPETKIYHLNDLYQPYMQNLIVPP